MTDDPSSTDDQPRAPGVLWDMGGILYRYFTEVLLDEAEAQGWDLTGVPMGPTGAVADPEYDAMDRGGLDEPAYLEVVRSRLRAQGIDADPVEVMDWPREFRDPVWAVIEALHAHGHPQAVLTNDAARWLGDGWWETWEPAPWFDTMVDVSTLGVRKPAARTYLVTAERLGLRPEQCLFIDDMRINCKGAEAVGMSSLWFDVTDVEDSLRRIRDRVGLNP